MRNLKEDMRALWPFWALFFIFLWPLLALKESFIGGDYFQQHLPWARFFYETWRHGRLPFWTDEMACGFPLVAEGQAGTFYLLQISAYRLLPFMAAYTWSIPFHLLAGGLGMHVYAKHMGHSRQAAAVAATVFVFGSGYAGCFYNTGSLRALCWLPWALLLLERMRRPLPVGRRAALCAALGLLISQQWTAGFAQLALYAFGYYFLYEAAAAWGRRGLRPMGWLLAAFLAGTAAAAPQIFLSAELVGQSVRHGESAAFALWASVPPVAPVSLLFPEWGNALRLSFYVGLLPLFFIIAGFAVRGRAFFGRHALLAIVFFLLALGHFNPLYAWAVERFSLTALRNPSKFLFFTATSLSVLAAGGFDALIQRPPAGAARCRRALAAAAALTAVLPAFGLGLVRTAQGFWSGYSRWYIERLVVLKGAEFKGTGHYLDFMDRFFSDLPRLFSYGNRLNLESIALALASLWLITAWLRRRLNERAFFFGVALLLVADLLFFGYHLGAGFIGNAAPLSSLAPTPQQSRLIATVREEGGRLVEAVEDPAKEWFPPNFNMWHGIRHAGGYSPLLLKRTYELTRDLGIADGSLGRPGFSETVWRKERGVLDLIGAKLIHSDNPLDWPGLRLLESRPGFYLYRNEQALPDFTVFDRWKVIADPKERLVFMKSPDYEAGRDLVLEKDPAAAAGSHRVALLRQPYYPGWHHFVDGKRAEAFRADHAFTGVVLKDAKQSVVSRYEPTLWRPALILSVAAFATLLATLLSGIASKP